MNCAKNLKSYCFSFVSFSFFLSILCRNVAMIKSSKDTRYATDSIVTHDGVKFPCWALPDLSSFRQKFGAEAYEKVFVVGYLNLYWVAFLFCLNISTSCVLDHFNH